MVSIIGPAFARDVEALGSAIQDVIVRFHIVEQAGGVSW